MKEILALTYGEIKTYVEVENTQDEETYRNNSPKVQMQEIAINEHIEPMIKIGEYMIEQLKKLSPDETELSFGITVSGEGKIMCFAKAAAEAQFNVKMTWKNK